MRSLPARTDDPRLVDDEELTPDDVEASGPSPFIQSDWSMTSLGMMLSPGWLLCTINNPSFYRG